MGQGCWLPFNTNTGISNSSSLAVSLKLTSSQPMYGISVPLAASMCNGSSGSTNSATSLNFTSGKWLSFQTSSMAQICEPVSQSAWILSLCRKHLITHFFPTNSLTVGVLTGSLIFLHLGFSYACVSCFLMPEHVYGLQCLLWACQWIFWHSFEQYSVVLQTEQQFSSLLSFSFPQLAQPWDLSVSQVAPCPVGATPLSLKGSL